MIDVVIPTRNAPEVLALCLAHYWANAHDDGLVASVTLLDNCSEAAGMDAVFADAIRRGAAVIRHEANVGVWTSINRGLALARSDRVFVLTSDVLLAPGTVMKLDRAMTGLAKAGTPVAMLGPEVRDFLPSLPWLYEPAFNGAGAIRLDHYNGACWLMERVLTETIGWFDPRFCVCFGDTDYVQRLRDGEYAAGILIGSRCVHLDKQSRRHDHTEGEDTFVEMRDAERFHEKWADRPDVLAKHPQLSPLQYAVTKAEWKEAIPQ